ncbi:HNH endonuclease signature motif containing protein [Pseudonocardia spinosispora]|uniref:HNH endonuclease signature motif containing protein n=1 Tax=Pseudonocardia spinosispora TaxID=103441 RepID=UPI0012EC6DF6|nr:HNH endonuclease signature motif containing protein [Pseudonocardia spinosispora]
MGERNYSKATEAAMFAMSIKCYYPGCRVPSVSIFGSDTKKNVQIAHIVAVSPGGPRYRMMSVDKRDSFGNLILLCAFHHAPVDRKANEKKYTEPRLLQWKEENEKDLKSKIKGLSSFTEGKLEQMLNLAVSSTKMEIMTALDKLEDVSRDTSNLLRLLLDKVERHYIDSDSVAALYAASLRFGHLEENASTLYAAAVRLGNLEENSVNMVRAADALTAIDTNAIHAASEKFEQFSQDFSGMIRYLPDVSGVSHSVAEAGREIVADIKTAMGSIENGPPVEFVADRQRWKFFLVGFFCAVVAVLAIAIMLSSRGSV